MIRKVTQAQLDTQIRGWSAFERQFYNKR